MHVIIVRGVVVRLSHVEPKVSGWNPASYPFFFPSVFLFFFFFFRFCSVSIVYFFVVVFEIYTFQSKDSIFKDKQSEFLSFPTIYIPFLLQYILQT